MCDGPLLEVGDSQPGGDGEDGAEGQAQPGQRGQAEAAEQLEEHEAQRDGCPAAASPTPGQGEAEQGDDLVEVELSATGAAGVGGVQAVSRSVASGQQADQRRGQGTEEEEQAGQDEEHPSDGAELPGLLSEVDVALRVAGSQAWRSDTASVTYDASPNREDEPVDVAEITQLLSSDLRPFAKNPNWIEHLLRRVAKTIDSKNRMITALDRERSKAAIARAQVGAPTTLSPLDAVKFLTPEQFASQADAVVRNTIEGAERAKREAKAMTGAATKIVSDVRLVLGGMVDDINVPDGVRRQLRGLLERSERNLPQQPEGQEGELGDLFGA